MYIHGAPKRTLAHWINRFNSSNQLNQSAKTFAKPSATPFVKQAKESGAHCDSTPPLKSWRSRSRS